MTDFIYSVLRKINWDYNIPEIDIYNCLKGNIPYAGFYTKEDIMVKLFQNLYWYDINKILTLDEIKLALTENVIRKLRFKNLQLKYGYLH